jgi:4-amino-4-deoxy-L-arabinose transferase-like glycosyltransferase
MPGSLTRVLPLAAVVLLGVLHLPFPFSSDQALSLVGARAVDGGATLYLDWWDIRQPGAIWFYALAGRLFGFSESGVHLLELIWMTCAALVVLAVARRMLARPALAALAPLLTIGMYYAWCSPFELTQAEGLALLPLSLCLLAAARDDGAAARGTATLWALFGLGAAGAGLLKSLMLLIPAALAVTNWALALRSGRARLRDVFAQRVLPAAGAALLVLAAVLLHFWRRGALDELYWTTVSAPLLHLSELPRAPYRALLASGAHFLLPWGAALPLWWFAIRGPRAQRRDASRHLILLASWIAAGSAAILVQRYYYGAYHFLPLLVPLGLLALRGAEVALDDPAAAGRPDARAAVQILLLLLLVGLAIPLVSKTQALRAARAEAGPLPDAYRRVLMPSYAPALRAAAAVSQDSAQPGAAFVFGDPLILAYSRRAQAIPLRGSALQFMLPEHWAALPVLLEQAAPSYVYVDRSLVEELRSRSPAVFSLLDARYRNWWSDDQGTWYERAPAAKAPPELPSPGVP